MSNSDKKAMEWLQEVSEWAPQTEDVPVEDAQLIIKASTVWSLGLHNVLMDKGAISGLIDMAVDPLIRDLQELGMHLLKCAYGLGGREKVGFHLPDPNDITGSVAKGLE